MVINKWINTYFSDYFEIDPNELESYGAFNISLINDLPLFIDPFLLFNSKKKEYIELHESMINYLRFLQGKSIIERLNVGELHAWFTFREIKQTWLGFSKVGNEGRGLGMDFASSINTNLYKIFSNFGREQVTKSSHLEKLCLIKTGVGKDNISDFTTNLIKEYLCNYTQEFTIKHIQKKYIKQVAVEKVRFNYQTESWETDYYYLPFLNLDYILLTPMDILTKGDIWISKNDMLSDFKRVLYSVPNNQLRAQLNNYFEKVLSSLPKKNKVNNDSAIMQTYLAFPQLIDYYIRYKEENGDQAESSSRIQIKQSKEFYVDSIKWLLDDLISKTDFYKIKGDTYDEAYKRVLYLKDIIENKGGWRIFFPTGDKPIRREEDTHILYRLTWYATPSDVTREANDGRGPVDYKISRGSKDKTLVEFKLASNTGLERNLRNQIEIYKKASDAEKAIKVIFYFSMKELRRVERIIKRLDCTDLCEFILIDARKDNKISASRA